MSLWRKLRPALTGVALAVGLVAATAPARAPTLIALDSVQRGQFSMRPIGGGPARSLCVSDPRVLLQLRHSGVQCSRFVIEDTPLTTTIHYTCPGAGHGRTTIKVETPRLLKLDTQGIAQNAPFAFEYELRRTGACVAPAGSGGR